MSRPDRLISEEQLQCHVDGRLSELQEAYVMCYLNAHPMVAARIADLEYQRQMVREAFLRIDDTQTPNYLEVGSIVRRVAERRQLRHRLVIVTALLASVTLFCLSLPFPDVFLG